MLQSDSLRLNRSLYCKIDGSALAALWDSTVDSKPGALQVPRNPDNKTRSADEKGSYMISEGSAQMAESDATPDLSHRQDSPSDMWDYVQSTCYIPVISLRHDNGYRTATTRFGLSLFPCRS